MHPRDPRVPGSPLRWRERAATVRRTLLRRRRLLAVLCAVAAVAAGLRVAAPPEARLIEVPVAARDLPAGSTLTAADLTTARLDPTTAPEGVVEDARGATLAAPLRAGETVTDVRLVGPDLVAADPAGTVAVPVRLTDAGQAGLLTVGDRIDLLGTDPQEGTTSTVATDALVLAVPAADSDAEGSGGSAAGGGAVPGRLVVLGVPPETVSRLTGAAVTSFVTYAWATR